MANAHGGRRPGSGRKKRQTVDEQQTRRDVLLKVLSPARWERVCEKIAAAAEGGEYGAVLPYLPYLLGSPKQQVELSGQVEHVQLDTARRLLRIVDGHERTG